MALISGSRSNPPLKQPVAHSPGPALFRGDEMMMMQEIFEALFGEKFSDEPVSEQTLCEIDSLRAIGRQILDAIRAQNEIRFPWLKEV
jgi:hypothetical protein